MSVSEANGVEIGTPTSHDNTTEARRFAAALDREQSIVVAVRESNRGDSVKARLARRGGDSGTRFNPPNGWEIEDVFIGSPGGTIVTLTRES